MKSTHFGEGYMAKKKNKSDSYQHKIVEISVDPYVLNEFSLYEGLGAQLNIAEGVVDPSPDANVTGIGMTVGLAIGTVVVGTGNVTLTGQQLNISQGTAIAEALTPVSVTGLGLNITLNTVFAGTTVVVPITGNGLTISLNSINNQIWTEVNTGTDATWTEIDTAA